MRATAQLLTLLALFCTSETGHAQSPAPVPPIAVLELFTSQGCSACPPADTMLKAYTERADIIALSMSVDYWDHLGWKDTLGSSKHTARQKAYVKALNAGSVFTPQMVVNGAAQVVGSKKYDIEKALRATSKPAIGSSIALTASRDAKRILIEVGATESHDAVRSATVWLVSVSPQIDIEIKRGENRGKTLTYHNVVRDIAPVGMWAGKPVRIELPATAIVETATRSAVLVQIDDGGPILRATWIAQ